MTTDHNEAMRLADELAKWARDYATTDFTDAMATKAAALLRKQAADLKSARAETNRIIALLDAANDERKALRAEVERLRVDAERLDHIEKHARCDPKMDGQHVWWPTNFKHALRGNTLRAAIDTARKATQ